MNRREFNTLIGGAAAWPLAAHGQPAMPTIGYLSTRSPGEAKYVTDALTRGLNETGYVGSNIIWSRHTDIGSAGSDLRRSDIEGRKAKQPACPAAHSTGADH
jgi:hypothetical protein